MNFVFLAGKLFREVIDATIFGSLLAVVALAIQCAGGRRIAPAWRYALWLVVLVRLVIPEFPESRWSIFNAPAWFQSRTPPKARVTVTLGEPLRSAGRNPVYFESSSITLAVPGPEPAAMKPEIHVWDVLGVCWLSISALILVRFGVGSCWLRVRLARDWRGVDPIVAQILSRTRARMRTRWNPHPVETSCVDSPALFGCLRPKLLLPRGIARELSETELQHVFSHELAHLKRGDLWTNLLMSLVQALHWFNPVVWLVLRRMRLERELACDALVLRSRPAEETRSYGETIVKLLERIAVRPRFPVVVGILEEKQSAVSRLTQIAEFGAKRGPSQKLGLTLALLFGLIGLSNAQSQKSDSAQASAPANPLVEGRPSIEKESERNVREDQETLRRLYNKQKTVVEKSQEETAALRARLDISEPEEQESEIVRRLEGDRIAAEARYGYFKMLADQLKAKNRKELRRIIPTLCPDAAMDRYLGDLAKVEQSYAANINNLGPEHPEMKTLVKTMKTINEQIEDRIDGVLAGTDLQVAQLKALVDGLQQRVEEAKIADAKKAEKYAPYFRAKSNLVRQEQGLEYLRAQIAPESESGGKEEPAPARGRKTSSLIQDARLLMELGKLDEAKQKLNEALQADPDNRAAGYYLKLAKERQSRTDARKSEQADDPLGFLGEDLLRTPSHEPISNPYATTNRNSSGRAKIARKLEQIVLPKWSAKKGTKLSEVIKGLDADVKARDPRETGINFIISSGESTMTPLTGQARAGDSPPVRDFVVGVGLAFENIRLNDLLTNLVEVLRAPGNRDSDRRAAFSIEDYGVVFHEQAQLAEPLFTRTYKLNPNTFVQGSDGIYLRQDPFTQYGASPGQSAGERGDAGPGGYFQFQGRDSISGRENGVASVTSTNSPSSIQDAVRNFFIAAGVNFPTNAQPSAEGGPGSRKAIFFNDHTGVLMVRATLADMDKVENALQTLSVRPAQVMIDSAVVEIKPGAAYEEDLLLRAITTNKSQGVITISEILTDPQIKGVISALEGRKEDDSETDPADPRISLLTEVDFQKVMAELKKAKGVSFLSAPKITTVSGRRARIVVEPGPSVEVLPTVQPDGATIELSTSVEIPQQKGKRPPLKGSAESRLWDSQTLVIYFPGGREHSTVVFVTPTIIGPAGNRVHDPGSIPGDIPPRKNGAEP